MSLQHKHIVIAARDLRTYLTPDLQQQFANLLTLITNAKQQQTNKPPTLQFVLNMDEKYALDALEAYMAAIDADDANQHNAGVIEARQHAAAVKQAAILTYDGTKLPS